VVDLASNALVLVPIGGPEVEGARLTEEAAAKAAEVELHGATDVAVHELTFTEAADLAFKAEGCGCFPGATGVLTPHGLVAIASLHMGDQVLAEDPATGKVGPEKVQAVIDDGIQPLMQVRLSDGSSLSVTTNHPFYVDSGPGVTKSAWVQAGDLRIGDRIRTESGRDVTVMALRHHTGQAHVYTLTVAVDHDFFVGSADVLVHNSTFCSLTESEIHQALQAVESNKLNHIFDNPGHNLAPLVTRLGSQNAVVEAVLRGIDKTQIPVNGIFKDLKVNVDGSTVLVRGRLVNGVFRIGTFFIP